MYLLLECLDVFEVVFEPHLTLLLHSLKVFQLGLQVLVLIDQFLELQRLLVEALRPVLLAELGQFVLQCLIFVGKLPDFFL